MKELSIEEKAKAYDKALERVKDFIEKQNPPAFDKNLIGTIFPELLESEDERIRKEIIDFIDTKTIDSDERRNRWFSYLEKYKPISFTSLEDTEVKMSLMQYISELNQDVVHLHPGIETCNEWIAWLEKAKEALYDKPTNEEDETSISINNPEAYRIGFADGEAHAKEEISAAWGEEDEHRIKDTIYFLETAKKHYASTVELDACIDWLKSIKDRIQPKQEWSEEDEKTLNEIFSVAARASLRKSTLFGKSYDYIKWQNWLKSLRPQNVWISVDEEVYVKEPVLAQKKDKSDQFGGFVVCCDHTLTPNIYERYMILDNIVSQNTWKPSDEQMDELENEYLKSIPKY